MTSTCPAARLLPTAPTLALLALAMGGFTINTAEFTAMSLLPQLADGLDVEAPTAGHAISAYAMDGDRLDVDNLVGVALALVGLLVWVVSWRVDRALA